MSLIQSFPSLWGLYLNGCGSTVSGIGEMYQSLNQFPREHLFQLPPLRFSDIILPSEDQQTISASVAANTKIQYISLTPTDRTIHSMTELTRSLAICHNITQLGIVDLHLTAENEVNFLAALEQWKHLERLWLVGGRLHKEGQEKLQEVIKETLHKLERLMRWSSFTLPDEEAMRMFCKARKIYFI